jgi:hypothetical protein
MRPGCTIGADGILSISNRDVIDDMIVRTQQAGEEFRLPLMRAARDARLNLVMVHGGDRVSKAALHFRRPTVIVLLDDLPTATGPDRWPQARKLLRWAHRAMFHASGGERQHYAAIAKAAEETGRALLVEMEFRHHSASLPPEACRACPS